MRAYLDTLRVITQIALRNLFASRLKTLIVGGIISFGALLVVVGTSLVDSVDLSMSRSIIGSVAGHIQVYSPKSRDELTVMGGMQMEGADLTPFDELAKLREVVLSVPNVQSVVPMGLSGATVTSGNTIDLVLEKLRDFVRRKLDGDSSPEVNAGLEAEKDHVRQIVTVLNTDLDNVRKIMDEKAVAKEDLDAVARAATDEFWASFDRDPLSALEFLENRVASLANDADMLFLRYVGTDPQAFAKSFDRLRVTQGTLIPRGKRGFMFSQWVYENQVKLKVALRLDKIRDGLTKRNKTIATDDEMQQWVRQNVTEVKEILLQLDRPKTALFRSKLQKELGSSEADVGKLLAEFLHVDDQSFARRYRFFYDELAPSLELYRVRIGDTLTIKGFTKSGYVQSVKLKVYGTFTFEGLEESHTAGELNIMDLVSFRELYGFMTTDRQREISALKASAGVKEVDRADAEAELFGQKQDDSAQQAASTAKAEDLLKSLAGGQKRAEARDAPYDASQLETGVVLNAAVLLKDPGMLKQSLKDIEAAGERVGLPLRAISWQKASGLVGQFVTMMRAVLYASVLIIFVVALVIINNALVMATLERVQEIGTLRAVGAQRRFIVAMLMIESLAVGVLFGAVGAGIGSFIVLALDKVGIPASNEILYFLFSGPRLHPGLASTNVMIAVGIVLLVSAVSSIYPGLLAMRVTPRQAMQSEE